MKMNKMDFADKLDVIKTEVDLLNKTKLRMTFVECLHVLNNRDRYIYFWQADTEAHKTWIRFICVCRRIQKESGQSLQDILYDFLGNISTKTYITLWLAFKLYHNKRDWFGFKLKYDKDAFFEELETNMGTIVGRDLGDSYDKAHRAFKIAKKFDKPYVAKDIKDLR